MVSQFFRGRSSGSANRLEKELSSLEEQVQSASPGYETQFLNRAGNLCVEAGEASRALGYYGRAIDAYLESGRFNAAEVLCRKVLQISPQAVRARCTLAWLALGKGVADSTRTAIADYVAAAEEAGQESFAAKQLVMMAEATTDEGLREEIAEYLLQLESTENSDHVFGLVYGAADGQTKGGRKDEGKLWTKLLRAALMGPKEMQQQSWKEGGEETEVLPSLVREDEE
jgi:tetratricopeptide (TPR) repeat protein